MCSTSITISDAVSAGNFFQTTSYKQGWLLVKSMSNEAISYYHSKGDDVGFPPLTKWRRQNFCRSEQIPLSVHLSVGIQLIRLFKNDKSYDEAGLVGVFGF